jgi:hypothetical protein
MKVKRNPKFKDESLVQVSWTRAVKNAYPCEHSTGCCDKRVYKGQIVVTIPVFRDGELVGTSVLHAYCLRKFLESVPMDRKEVEENFYAILGEFVKS